MARPATVWLVSAVVAMLALSVCAYTIEQTATTSPETTLEVEGAKRLLLIKKPAAKKHGPSTKYTPKKTDSKSSGYMYGSGEKVYGGVKTKADEYRTSAHAYGEAHGSKYKHGELGMHAESCKGSHCKKEDSNLEEEGDEYTPEDSPKRLLLTKKPATKKHGPSTKYTPKKTDSKSSGYMYGSGEKVYGGVKTKADEYRTSAHAYGEAHGSKYKHGELGMHAESCKGSHCKKEDSNLEEEGDEYTPEDSPKRLLLTKKPATKKHGPSTKYTPKKTDSKSSGYMYGSGEKVYGGVKTKADEYRTSAHAYGEAHGSKYKHGELGMHAESCKGSHCKKEDSKEGATQP